MKSTEVRTLITEARRAGVSLWVEGEHLHYKSPAGGMPGELRARLRSNKSAVTAELSQPVFKDRGRKKGLWPLPAYCTDFWQETGANPSLANATHRVVKITGAVTLPRLRTLFQEAFSRHDILRARLMPAESAPSLQFDSEEEIPLEVKDFSRYDSDECVARTKALVERTIWDRFENGPVFRACLIKVAADEFVFGFVLHHLVGDLASCYLLMRDFLTGVLQPKGSPSKGRPVPPATRPLQYADYVLGMSEWLSGPALQYRLDYWRELMREAPPVCFPGAGELGSASVAALASISFDIDERLRGALARVAANCGITLLTVILAANFAALARVLQRTDLVTLPILAGRDHPALFELVAMTVDCFPVRASVQPGMTFSELLQQVHATYMQSRNYHVPWTILRGALRERGVSGVAPLLNFVPGVYGLSRRPGNSSPRGSVGVEAVTVAGPAETSSVDWKSHELHVFDSGELMQGKVKYMPARYRKETIEGFIAAFTGALEAIAANPGSRIERTVA